MVALDYVWFWPASGRRDEPWPHSYGVDYSAEDAFLRTSRRVTERYSEVLAASPLDGRRPSIDMGVNQYGPDDETVSVHMSSPSGENGVRVDIPPTVATLAAQDRARLVLDVVDLTMRTIGDFLGWPQDVLDRARQHTIDHGLSFSMAGPWKTDRSRKRRARPVARISDDGWSELCFEIVDARDDTHLGYTSTVVSALNALPVFKRDAREFRWADASTIERPHDWQARSIDEWGQLDTFNVDDLRPWPEVVLPVPDRSPFPIRLARTDGPTSGDIGTRAAEVDEEDVSSEFTAPAFAAHFTDPIYRDVGLETAPFGSDEGADMLAIWDEKRHELGSDSTVADVLEGDPDEYLSYHEVDSAQAVQVAAFTLLRLTGHIDSAGRRATLAALDQLLGDDMFGEDAVLIQQRDDLLSWPD